MIQDPYAACADLRFAEGLRRRSAESRAEAAIREACALAMLEGARVSSEALREEVMDPRGAAFFPDQAIAVGYWRAAWSLVSALPELNQRGQKERVRPLPWRQRLSGWHTDMGVYRSQVGLCLSDAVGVPTNPRRVPGLIADLDHAQGVEGAALAWKRLATEPLFAFGNDALGALAAKQILAQSGVEPTAVAVISYLAAKNPARYRELVLSGDESLWTGFLGESIVAGAEVGQQIARLVQAGRTH